MSKLIDQLQGAVLKARAVAARERSSNAWLPISAAVPAVAALAVAAVLYFLPSAPKPATLEEPLKLRLEPVLGSYKG